MPLIAYSILLAFIVLYAVLSSIEFGAALFLISPWKVVERETIEKYMGPVWESTNVFLIFALVCTAMFFPRAVPLLAQLYAVISTALVFFVVRVIGILGILYRQSSHGFFRALFAIGSIGAPLSLSCVYLYAISGQQLMWPPQPLAVALWCAVLSAIVFIAAAFFLHFAPKSVQRTRLETVHTLSGAALLLSGAFVSSAAGSFLGPESGGFVLLTFFVACAILWRPRKLLLALLCSAAAVATLIISIAVRHAPYLLYPSLTLNAAFTSPESFTAMLSVIPVGLVVSIPAVALLWKLFAGAQNN